MKVKEKKKTIELISKVYGKPVHYKLIKKLFSSIPTTLADEKHVEILTLKSYNEYKTYLLLYDKMYLGKSHDYGEKEELVFSIVRNIKPGLVKEHRIRNDRGIFKNDNEVIEPCVEDTPNILLIKSHIWDSLKDESDKTIYTIVIYNDKYSE